MSRSKKHVEALEQVSEEQVSEVTQPEEQVTEQVTEEGALKLLQEIPQETRSFAQFRAEAVLKAEKARKDMIAERELDEQCVASSPAALEAQVEAQAPAPAAKPSNGRGGYDTTTVKLWDDLLQAGGDWATIAQLCTKTVGYMKSHVRYRTGVGKNSQKNKWVITEGGFESETVKIARV